MRALLVAGLVVTLGADLAAQGAHPVQHGVRPARYAIRNATIVEGNGTPASGPFDIIVEGNTIAQIVGLDPVAVAAGNARRPAADFEIDATGKFVLPGLINAHGHLQDGRGGKPQPIEYEFKLWLASGITTVRDVGSDWRKALDWRTRSAAGTLEAPRLLLYPVLGSGGDAVETRGFPTPETVRARVRALKAQGADGIKSSGIDRDLMEAMLDEAKKAGLWVAHHAGVEETNAWDDIKFGTRSIEHWYGVPDAAIPDGRQNFPSDYNYNDEVDRFRWAGRLWREADPKRLGDVLQSMADSNVAWVPTLVIYEASRDLQRAQSTPWFADYLHPTLAEYFRPNPANHGSYFIGWSSTDEAYWKENYRIWMPALRDFERRGGLIGAGEDAGFIYQMYGFGLIRELELHQEAGFHPLKVIQHATWNNARILGMETKIGRVRAGYLADLI
ncbi:MAG: amidohydrolase family protein, partial [Gemmatimonadales bacterium]|nr:amidohydrolase family protein [Gemmatimonadales bacterium]